MENDTQSSAAQALSAWTQQAAQNRLTEWDRFPEIYLYMDQVLSFMESQLHLYEQEDSPLLTSSMINNYVKDGVLPRPEKKKYRRDHLTQLTIICLLKQVLSIPEIHTLMLEGLQRSDTAELYDSFCHAQEAAYREVCGRIDAVDSNDRSALARLALQLSVEAGARRTAAERLLYTLQEEEAAPPTEV